MKITLLTGKRVFGARVTVSIEHKVGAYPAPLGGRIAKFLSQGRSTFITVNAWVVVVFVVVVVVVFVVFISLKALVIQFLIRFLCFALPRLALWLKTKP